MRQAGEVAILCRYLDIIQCVRLTYLEPRKDFVWSNPPENNYVDKHVFAKLKMLNILPSDLCTDQEFVRRAYLDLCGILPTPDEVRAFLADKAADKRAKLIDQLLERPEFADFWTLQVAGRAPQQPQDDPDQGQPRLPAWLRSHIEQQHAVERGRRASC